MRQRWIGEHLYNIIYDPIPLLCKKYPDYTAGTLKGKKAYWTKKLREGKIQMPEKPPQENTHEGMLTSTWEAAAYDKEKGEWVHTTLSAYRHTPTVEDLSERFVPAVAANITPTKQKRVERIGRQILVFGDSQIGYHRVYNQDGSDELIPIHSEEALSVLAQINAHERPEIVVNISDTVDNAELGRFDHSSDSFHRTLGPSYQRAHDLYAQLRSDNPDAQLIEMDSNHTARVQKAMMKRYPEWYGFTLPNEEYPMMSYYRLANLGAVGVRFISGYGGAEYVHGQENGTPIVFRHGNHSSSAPGATIRKEAQQNPTTHVVRGHGHSYEHIAQTTKSGEVLHYIQLGTTCATTGAVPSYHSSMDDFGHPVHRQENWQNQICMIEDFEDGMYNFNVIDIIRGIAYYKGIRYEA